MKSVYDNIPLQPGAHTGGIFSIFVIPKDFVTADPVIDFNTGKVTTALTLADEKDWQELQFTPDSYDYDETPKSPRTGTYYEITLKGVLNNVTPDTQQIINTLRYHELICLVKDRQKNIKLVGDRQFGMILQFNSSNLNTSGGKKTIPVVLSFDSEHPAPFYEV